MDMLVIKNMKCEFCNETIKKSELAAHILDHYEEADSIMVQVEMDLIDLEEYAKKHKISLEY